VTQRKYGELRFAYNCFQIDFQVNFYLFLGFKAAGAFVVNKRVNGVLAISRALGHSSEKSFLLGTPFTSKTVLAADDEFLILACDGVHTFGFFGHTRFTILITFLVSAFAHHFQVWDVMGDQEAVDYIRTKLEVSLSSPSSSA
jgi:hypothetical protein